MRVIETKVYSFNELSKEAQAKAIQANYDLNVTHDWWQFMYEDAETIGLKLNGFNLDRGTIEGEFIDDEIACAKNIVREHGKKTTTYKTSKKFIAQMVGFKLIFGDAMDTGDLFYGDEETIQEVFDQFKKDLLKDYLKMLQVDYDYQTSDAAIKETILANEYEFEEDGTMI